MIKRHVTIRTILILSILITILAIYGTHTPSISQTTGNITPITDGYRIDIGEKVEPVDVIIKDNIISATLTKWDKECSLTLSQLFDIDGDATVNNDKINIKEKADSKEIYLYAVAASNTDDGGFEFDITLKEKPASNVITFNLDSKNLRFCYQPPLTEQLENGWSDEFECNITVSDTEVRNQSTNFLLIQRPYNIVGSYAVYHESKRNNKYKTGKAFHIYRPQLEDAKGNKCYGMLNIDGDELTVTIPQDFLDKAIYPIYKSAGLVIGYDEIAGSAMATVANKLYANRYSGVEGGTANATIIYVKDSGEGFKGGLYKFGGYEVASDFAAGSNEVTAPADYDWITCAYTEPYVMEDMDYFITLFNGTVLGIKYDSDSVEYGRAGATYNGWPDTGTFYLQTVGGIHIFSLYMTYTPGATPTPTPTPAAGGQVIIININ